MKNCVVASLIMIIGFSIISYGANEKASFEDVNETAWYYPEVQYVVNEGLMNGVSEDKFDPNIPVTREMITTALWRLESLKEHSVYSFKDVDRDTWYSDAVAWITNHHIAEGYGNGLFGVKDNATREQAVQLLYAYYDKYRACSPYNTIPFPERTIIVEEFQDYEKVSAWAKEAVDWAINHGIIKGDGIFLKPDETVTRAEMAVLLSRFHQWLNLIDNEYGYRNFNIAMYSESEGSCSMGWTTGDSINLLVKSIQYPGKELEGIYQDPTFSLEYDMAEKVESSKVLFLKWIDIQAPVQSTAVPIEKIYIIDTLTDQEYQFFDQEHISRIKEFFDGFEIEFKEEKPYIENLRYKAIFTGSIPSRQIIEFDFGNGIIEQNNDKQIFCYYGYNREYFSEKRVSSLIE